MKLKPKSLKTVFNSRIAQFGVIGAVLFLINRVPDDHHVTISKDELRALFFAQAQKQGTVLLNKDEKMEVAGRALEDEILYREGIQMGFDREDHIIKQRVVQKVLALAEFIGGAPSKTTEEELRAYYQLHPEKFESSPLISFSHVFVRAENKSRLRQLSKLTQKPGFENMGDAFLYSTSLSEMPEEKVEEIYGKEFLESLRHLELGKYIGPIHSKYGYHYVKVENRKPKLVKKFEEALNDVRFAHEVERRKKLTSDYIASLKKKYTIELDEPDLDVALLKGRVPFRNAAALEVEGD